MSAFAVLAANGSSVTFAMMSPNVVPITGRAGTEPRSTDGNHTAGPHKAKDVEPPETHNL